MSSDAVDPFEIAADWTPRLARALDRAIDVRDSGRFPAERFHDVHFRALLADPLKLVEGIYGHFGIELTGEAADRMRAFIDENPQGKHGVHRYAAAEYGLDVAVRARALRALHRALRHRAGARGADRGPRAGPVSAVDQKWKPAPTPTWCVESSGSTSVPWISNSGST